MISHSSLRTFQRLAALAIVGSTLTGCANYLYMGTSAPAIEAFNVKAGSNGLPQFVRIPGVNLAPSLGVPSAMSVVDKTLYAAVGGNVPGTASIAQFSIDANSGALALRGTIAAGNPPHYMAATRTAVYAASFGSDDIRAYAIDAAGNLGALQTLPGLGVNSVHIDAAAPKVLYTGTRAQGATGSKICAYSITANSTLGTTPQCVAVAGAPGNMQAAGGVLFVHFNATVPPQIGNSNWISAWSIDPATGALTHRGADVDIGAAYVGGMAVSANGQTLFVPRIGGFTTVNTANPISSGMVTFPQNGSPACVLPPTGPSAVLADPSGKAIYLADAVGAVANNNTLGPRISALELAAGGAINPIICDSTGAKPQALALFAQ